MSNKPTKWYAYIYNERLVVRQLYRAPDAPIRSKACKTALLAMMDLDTYFTAWLTEHRDRYYRLLEVRNDLVERIALSPEQSLLMKVARRYLENPNEANEQVLASQTAAAINARKEQQK